MQQQIGTEGSATLPGVRATTVSFAAPGNQDATQVVQGNAGTFTLSIYTQIRKSPGADRAMTRDNDNEVINKRRSNKTMSLSFSAKIVANNVAAAKLIAANCPLLDDVCVIACADDPQSAGTAYIESADVVETPEGETVMDITAIKYANNFIPLG